jgi:hypothetical protein
MGTNFQSDRGDHFGVVNIDVWLIQKLFDRNVE